MSRRPTGESLDRLVAVGLALVAEAGVWATNATPGPKGLTAPLALLLPASIAFRRRHPLAVGCFASAAFVALLIADGPQTNLAIAVAVFCAWYGLAVWTDTRGFLVGCAAVAATSMLGQLGPEGSLDNGVFFTVVPLLAMLIARRAVRDRELRAEALEARAELLEREQQLRARDAVADERARIARELHDLVAHNVSLMVVQAGAERHSLPEEQSSTREVLASIERAGRQALAEARRLLGVLRRDDAPDELEPQPGVARIDALVDEIRRAGLPVELDIQGEQSELPAGLDLCAYRIVQEGLTNALKHAGPAKAEVSLCFGAGALDVHVVDDGRGGVAANGNGGGHGLVGMRERVALYGGELHAGPRDARGFEIRAHLPLA